MPAIKASPDLQTLKGKLDDLVVKYKTLDYIPKDPISHPYGYLHDAKTCELVAFITSLFSYGRRDVIIPTIANLFWRMDNDPLAFVENFDLKRDAGAFNGFVYRFNKAPDIVFLLQRLKWAYQEFGSLEQLFIESANQHQAVTLQRKISAFLDTLTGISAAEEALPSNGLKFLFAHPVNGGPCKRINMFLRWVVRQDLPHEPQVDLGLWKKALKPSELVIPLDTHVGKMNQHFGFTKRLTNTWETAEEITAVFRQFCPEDPIKYDYALMGYSLSKEWMEASAKPAKKAKPGKRLVASSKSG